jgi:hypothetical protein
MGIHGFYENKYDYQEHQGHDYGQSHSEKLRNISEGHYLHHGSDRSYYLSYILDKIRNNKKLRIWIGFLGLFFLIVIIALAIILIPLIVKSANFISQYGIQGVVDNIGGFLGKIWNGVGK